jgi:hypothetical protein
MGKRKESSLATTEESKSNIERLNDYSNIKR